MGLRTCSFPKENFSKISLHYVIVLLAIETRAENYVTPDHEETLASKSAVSEIRLFVFRWIVAREISSKEVDNGGSKVNIFEKRICHDSANSGAISTMEDDRGSGEFSFINSENFQLNLA